MLETIATFFKENWLKTVSNTVAAIVALFAAIWGFSEHFATAADLTKVERKVDATGLEIQIQLNKQSVRDLKGKVSDIEDKPKLEQPDKNKKARLEREITEIQKENELLTRQKFQLERK